MSIVLGDLYSRVTCQMQDQEVLIEFLWKLMTKNNWTGVQQELATLCDFPELVFRQ